MRDFEHDLLKRPDTDLLKAPAKDATSTTSKGPVAPVRHPALDVASVMRLQRTAGNQGVIQMLAGDEERSPVHEVVGSGGGTPLDAGTRGSMESAFGTSFEDVRVHTDAQASKSAESVGANAYTVGSDVVFRSGHYDPGTPTGQRTIAHELSHVVQQSQGPVDGSDAPGGIKVSDPSDRFEQAADHRPRRSCPRRTWGPRRHRRRRRRAAPCSGRRTRRSRCPRSSARRPPTRTRCPAAADPGPTCGPSEMT
jgi:hypothetical protein